eukprot:3063834-Prymnesium_polylepis.3
MASRALVQQGSAQCMPAGRYIGADITERYRLTTPLPCGGARGVAARPGAQAPEDLGFRVYR